MKGKDIIKFIVENDLMECEAAVKVLGFDKIVESNNTTWSYNLFENGEMTRIVFDMARDGEPISYSTANNNSDICWENKEMFKQNWYKKGF